MWFGTSKGLYNFDGKNQRHYTTKQGLENNVVTALRKIHWAEFGLDTTMASLDFFNPIVFKYLMHPRKRNQDHF